jgi:hypothetical protein
LNTVAVNTGCSVGDSVGVSVGTVSVGLRVGYPVGEKIPLDNKEVGAKDVSAKTGWGVG